MVKIHKSLDPRSIRSNLIRKFIMTNIKRMNAAEQDRREKGRLNDFLGRHEATHRPAFPRFSVPVKHPTRKDKERYRNATKDCVLKFGDY